MDIVHNSKELIQALGRAVSGDEIFLKEGVYRVKTVVRAGVTLTGAGMDKTVLIWDDYAQKRDELGREYVTFRTWTLAVCADGVTVRDLSIVNDALRPEVRGQEVALTVYGDRFPHLHPGHPVPGSPARRPHRAVRRVPARRAEAPQGVPPGVSKLPH